MLALEFYYSGVFWWKVFLMHNCLFTQQMHPAEKETGEHEENIMK